MDFLLEVGCEEIPARFLKPALVELGSHFESGLGDARLNPTGEVTIETKGTPRRLVLRAIGLPKQQPDLDEEVLGPKVEVAFDADGQPTKACLGFARSRGVEVEQLTRVQAAKGEVVAVQRHIEGQPTAAVLADVVTVALGRLSFPKTMRWGAGEHAFARPVHWLLALLDGEVLPLSFAGIASGRQSRGHRFTHPAPFDVQSAGGFEADLEKRNVIVEAKQRRAVIQEQTRALAAEAGGRLVEDDGLADEITYLTERPLPLLGSFEASFLDLPREVLIAAMRNHQRYFSVEREDGQLQNAFVAVSNTPVDDPQQVRYGYERVLAARLADAQFFYKIDQQKPPADRVADLQEMIFQADLGSYYDKAVRMATLGVSLAHGLGLGAFDALPRVIEALYVDADGLEQESERLSWRVARAALLAKTDLLTEIVGEFPELQGIMGGAYARLAGEASDVAEAIRQHYRPRFSGDTPPDHDVAAILSLADRLDTLAGGFGVGLRPTGAADPYALRRQCLGVIATVLERGYRMSLRQALAWAVHGVYDKVESARLRKAQEKARRAAARKKKEPVLPQETEPFSDELIDDLIAFFGGRLRQRLIDQAPVDVVDAVLSAGFDDLSEAQMRVSALAAFASQPAFADLAVAFKRVANIIKEEQEREIEERLLDMDAERELFSVYQRIRSEFDLLMTESRFAEGLNLLAAELRQPVDHFFEKVLVNDPNDPERQANRKALLVGIAKMFGRIADFTKLHTKED